MQNDLRYWYVKKHFLETLNIQDKFMVTNTGQCQYCATKHKDEIHCIKKFVPLKSKKKHLGPPCYCSESMLSPSHI